MSSHDEHVGRTVAHAVAGIPTTRHLIRPSFLTRASLNGSWRTRRTHRGTWCATTVWRKFKLANPHVILRGMVFLGKNVEIHSTPELSRLEIGRWVHIGDGNAIRCHEGSLRIGDKVVFGKDNVVNTYLDIEIGASTLVADWCYICDFDHRMDDINVPIKDQGIVKGPVRIGPDTWIAAKVTVLRKTRVGRGCVLGAHAVVKGDIPDYSIAVGCARQGGPQPQGATGKPAPRIARSTSPRSRTSRARKARRSGRGAP